ncbi:Bud site selection protein 22 [Yarrowia sp. B02]|nr:Bud site selection protein 22 [Yarrowia sp. B02]
MVKRKRENLLGKLDKLRAAGDPEKARLGATKEYLEGMQIVKKAKLHQNPDLELEEEKVDENAVLEVQRKIAGNKLHFGDKELVRALKIAQKSEVQKNNKKIATLESGQELKGRGSKDVTVESLQGEIDMLNKIDLEQLAKIVAIRTLQKAYTGEDKQTPQWLPEWFLDESSEQMEEFKTFREAATREEINLHTRMTAQKGVRTACEQYTKRLDKALGEIDEKEVNREAAEKKDKAEKAKKEKTEPKKAPKEPKAKEEQKVEEEVEEEVDEFGQPVKLSNIDISDAESDDGFFENSAAQFSDDDMEENYPQMSMATGYISGSDDEDIDNDKVVKGATKKERKNRRGQAARQRIWELKYGSQANHLKKQRQERYDKSQQLQREWEEREAKRQERRNRMSAEEREAEDERQRRKKLGLKPEPRKHRDDSGPLHPSWQAKKAQSNVSFAGKKMVFGEDKPAAPAKPKGPAKDDEGPLHPSWAAKKAQSASTAFAGKKMTF